MRFSSTSVNIRRWARATGATARLRILRLALDESEPTDGERAIERLLLVRNRSQGLPETAEKCTPHVNQRITTSKAEARRFPRTCSTINPKNPSESLSLGY